MNASLLCMLRRSNKSEEMNNEQRWNNERAVMMTSQRLFKCARNPLFIHILHWFIFDYCVSLSIIGCHGKRLFLTLFNLLCRNLWNNPNEWIWNRSNKLHTLHIVRIILWHNKIFIQNVSMFKALRFDGTEKSIILVINKLIAIEWTWRQIFKQT